LLPDEASCSCLAASSPWGRLGLRARLDHQSRTVPTWVASF
jgi:hypothetical protein